MARKSSKKPKGKAKKPKTNQHKAREFDAVVFFTAFQSFMDGEVSLLQAGEESGVSYPTFKKYANEFLLEVYDEDSFQDWLKRHNGKYNGELGTFDEWVIRAINGDKTFRRYFDHEEREKRNNG